MNVKYWNLETKLHGKDDFSTKPSRTRKRIKFANKISSKEEIHEGFETMKNEVF